MLLAAGGLPVVAGRFFPPFCGFFPFGKKSSAYLVDLRLFLKKVLKRAFFFEMKCFDIRLMLCFHLF
jgi:hypothetical protein